MAKINQKLDTFLEALETLHKSIQLFSEYTVKVANNPTERDKTLFLAVRDSIIQRFEYCTDLLWKLLKVYLEDIEKVTLTTYSPRSIIRKAASIKLITEKESNMCLEMIQSRNQTSHIYHEEIAQEIAQKIPAYYDLLDKIVQKLQKRIQQVKPL